MDTDCASLKLYLGVRLGEQPYYRLPLKDVQASKTVVDLKTDVEPLLKRSNKEMEFIYCGRILNDDQSLDQQHVRAGSTIHVVQRTSALPSGRRFEVQEADIVAAVSALRKVTVQVTLVKSFSPAAIRDVLEEYPEFYTEIGALAILRNLLLWSKIGKIENARRIAETYPILIISAPFVVKAFRKHGGALGRDELSDGSVTSDDEIASPVAAAGPTPRAGATAAAIEAFGLRRAVVAISRNQLANALVMAGSLPDAAGPAGTPAVGPVSDDAIMSAAASSDAAVATTSGPSTSTPSSSSSSLSAAATSASSVIAASADSDAARTRLPTGNRISNAAFNNALRDAYRLAAEQQPQQPPPDDSVAMPDAVPIAVDDDAPPQPAAAAAAVSGPVAGELDAYLEQARQQYTAELQIMHDMGLTNVVRNASALLLCDGDVERAINLVLSGM